MNDHVQLADALAAVDAAGGKVTLVNGRVQVDVDQELPEAVWQTLARHRDELAITLVSAGLNEDTDGSGWDSPMPPWPNRHELPMPAGVECCDRCRSTEATDTHIHGGQSIRRDCARCGRFRKFIVWHGVTMP